MAKRASTSASEPKVDAQVDASPVVLPWEADVDAPMEGAVRAEMLARVAGNLPEQDQAGYVAFVDERVKAAEARDDGGEFVGGVSFGQASELLGDYMAARLAEQAAALAEMDTKVRALEGQLREAKSEAAAESAKGPKGQRAKSEPEESGTPSLRLSVSGSLVDVVVAAVRARCAALALERVTAEDRGRDPGAGLEALDIKACERVIDEVGDPLAEIRAAREAIDTLAIDLGKAIKDAKQVLADAVQVLTDRGAEVHRYDLERARLARLRIAAIQAARAKANAIAEAEKTKKLVEAGKITL